ncbi:hypothetical protein BCV70DRAFT_18751 [Testicularia cyperi]|uniref:Uncharacterized protein n=1 Tax=Testicularia cyperi TaxID=1882483 RepID=A0A317Y1T0_9BASI|nr:hypothetical protein BCV70DRAFT_18751 [Testicularia cyperi]
MASVNAHTGYQSGLRSEQQHFQGASMSHLPHQAPSVQHPPQPQPMHQRRFGPPVQMQHVQQTRQASGLRPVEQQDKSWQGDRMLHIYLWDYFRKRGFSQAAQALVDEAGVPPDQDVPIDAPQGLIFEWWTVFWEIFTARSIEPSAASMFKSDGHAYNHSQDVTRSRALQDQHVRHNQHMAQRAALPIVHQGPSWPIAAAAIPSAMTNGSAVRGVAGPMPNHARSGSQQAGPSLIRTTVRKGNDARPNSTSPTQCAPSAPLGIASGGSSSGSSEQTSAFATPNSQTSPSSAITRESTSPQQALNHDVSQLLGLPRPASNVVIQQCMNMMNLGTRKVEELALDERNALATRVRRLQTAQNDAQLRLAQLHGLQPPTGLVHSSAQQDPKQSQQLPHEPQQQQPCGQGDEQRRQQQQAQIQAQLSQLQQQQQQQLQQQKQLQQQPLQTQHSQRPPMEHIQQPSVLMPHAGQKRKEPPNAYMPLDRGPPNSVRLGLEQQQQGASPYPPSQQQQHTGHKISSPSPHANGHPLPQASIPKHLQQQQPNLALAQQPPQLRRAPSSHSHMQGRSPANGMFNSQHFGPSSHANGNSPSGQAGMLAPTPGPEHPGIAMSPMRPPPSPSPGPVASIPSAPNGWHQQHGPPTINGNPNGSHGVGPTNGSQFGPAAQSPHMLGPVKLGPYSQQPSPTELRPPSRPQSVQGIVLSNSHLGPPPPDGGHKASSQPPPDLSYGGPPNSNAADGVRGINGHGGSAGHDNSNASNGSSGTGAGTSVFGGLDFDFNVFLSGVSNLDSGEMALVDQVGSLSGL